MHTRPDYIKDFSNLAFLEDFKNTAYWLSARGWSEAAGGNMSVRFTPDTAPHETVAHKLPVSAPKLAGQCVLLTGSGTRARETALTPQKDVSLIYISQDAQQYHKLAGHKNPTSELPAHLAIHNALATHRPEDKAIMHTHPANIIALCHVEALQSAHSVSDTVLRLQSEARLIIPEGIGYVPHQIPGSLELGLLSAEQVKTRRLVLWHMHGCLATGPDLASAYDLMEVFEKSASLYWTLRTSGIEPTGMSDEDLQKTLKSFGRWQRYQSVQD
ncbi:MAG TPA: rhamnulose-1-phosphate aldolase [Hellea balneolensis]|uniref:Rhamnulose-1-phosphate aldolase n=1 Tax=Hellea balneolensis TaxID=287478 RepID=A0A7C3GBD7_9PROT|nr:rhamnulose-1-phosphate aldolase [Hellea balneolensis]